MSYPTPGPNGPFSPPPGYGAPMGYAAPGVDPRMARAAKVSDSARNSLLLCAIGWLVGLMWITGPLAWYQSNVFRKEFEALGLAPSSDVDNLRLFGIITTIVVAAGVAFVCLAIAVVLVVGVAHF